MFLHPLDRSPKAPDLPRNHWLLLSGERFSELLHNACKYTPCDETITVIACAVATVLADKPGSLKRCRSLSCACATVEMTVTNSGVDVPAAKRDRIFDKFYRIPHSDPWKRGGTGLDLALVKKLVDCLEGEI